MRDIIARFETDGLPEGWRLTALPRAWNSFYNVRGTCGALSVIEAGEEQETIDVHVRSLVEGTPTQLDAKLRTTVILRHDGTGACVLTLQVGPDPSRDPCYDLRDVSCIFRLVPRVIGLFEDSRPR